MLRCALCQKRCTSHFFIEFFSNSRYNKIGNLYHVSAIINGKELFGLVTEDGKEIIPISKIFLTVFQIYNNGKDMLLAFKYNRCKSLEYYHIRNYDDGTSKIIFKTDRKSEIPLSIGAFKSTEDYWVIEMASKNDEKYAIYDYKENKMISTFFDEVTYLEDNPYHAFYYSLNIESEITNPDGSKKPYIHSTLCGFLDEKGNLSSQIYDTESNAFYSSYMYGDDTLSSKFNELVTNLTKEYEKAYYSKDDHIDDVLDYMASYPDMSEKPKNYKESNKILEYKPRKKV